MVLMIIVTMLPRFKMDKCLMFTYDSTSSALVDATAANVGTSGGGGSGLTLDTTVSGTRLWLQSILR